MNPRRPSRTAPALVALAVAALVAGCSAQDGDTAAGVRITAATASEVPRGDVGGADPSVAAAAGIAPCPAGDAGASPLADGLPDLTLPCVGSGPDVRLSALRGVPMVVNVWAGWCAPCRDELPMLAEVASAAGPAVRFLGIDALETSPDDAVALLGSTGATYASVRDDDGATRAGLRWTGPPMTVLVRPDGTVAYRLPAQLTSADQLRELIHEHLGVDVA